MRVEIRTTGGFTGRGTGNVVIEDAKALRLLIDAALLSAETVPQRAAPDSIQYEMTVEHGSHRRTFVWTDSSAPAPAVLALFNAAWAMRQ